MSTTTQPLRLAYARPSAPARRALLALAESLARLALRGADRPPPDRRALAAFEDAQARADRARDLWLALTPPLR